MPPRLEMVALPQRAAGRGQLAAALPCGTDPSAAALKYLTNYGVTQGVCPLDRQWRRLGTPVAKLLQLFRSGQFAKMKQHCNLMTLAHA